MNSMLPFPALPLLLACSMLFGCAAPGGMAVKGATDVTFLSGTEQVVLDCDSSRELTLDYSMAPSGGSWRIELLAPNGETVASVPDRGRHAQTLRVPGAAGRWTCQVSFAGFRGSYCVKLEVLDD